MNMKQIQKMMRQAQEMQKRVEEEMNRLSVSGSSGGGMVTITMDGKRNLLSIKIQPEAVDPEDVEMLEDLLIAAFKEAGRKVDEALQGQLGGLAGGLLG